MIISDLIAQASILSQTCDEPHEITALAKDAADDGLLNSPSSEDFRKACTSFKEILTEAMLFFSPVSGREV
jgi:hypothetical protein